MQIKGANNLPPSRFALKVKGKQLAVKWKIKNELKQQIKIIKNMHQESFYWL